MKKKQWYRLIYALIIILIIGIIYFGSQFFPKYAVRLYGLGVFLLADLLCFQYFRGYAAQLKPWLANLVKIWYWIPLGFLTIFLISAIILAVEHWLPFFRIYFPGIIVLAFISKFIVLAFFFLGELLALPFNLINRFIFQFYNREANRFRQIFLSAGFGISLVVTITLFSGFFFWVYDFKVKTVEIPIPDLPQGLEGMRIIQISDLHTGSWMSASVMGDAFRMVNEQNPDVILFTGDIVNFTTSEVYPFESTLRQLRAPLGVYAILGNHDYGDYVKWNSEEEHLRNNMELEQFYSKIGWHLLKNSYAVLHRNKDSLVLLGVENWSSKKIWGQKGDLAKAANGTEYIPLKVLLTHDPTHWDTEVLDQYPGIQLTLSGHTHGMQMGYISERKSWSPAQYIFPHWGGLYSIFNMGKEQFLYVNPGLGHLGLPGRVGIKPEITLIILRGSI